MIGNNINELISIAESQSDERLAQELNPQTETGMLGPTWLPAAELSFREKMRSGAQAQQQQNNGSIIDQLAQSAMMPQGMPPQGMPPQQQMMPQQMPQGMMPQQPMPQQMPPQQPMPPQMMAEGGMIGGSMSGIGLMENMMEEGGMQGLLQMLSNKRKDEDQDPVTQQEQMMEQNAMASGGMASGGIVNYANGGQIPLYQGGQLQRRIRGAGYGGGDPYAQEEIDYLRNMTTGEFPPTTSPIKAKIGDFFKSVEGYGDKAETEQEILARQINKDIEGDLNTIQSQGGTTGQFVGTIGDIERMSEAEKFYEDQMSDNRPTGISLKQRVQEDDSLTMSRYFANNPDAYRGLQKLQSEHGNLEGLLQFAEANTANVSEDGKRTDTYSNAQYDQRNPSSKEFPPNPEVVFPEGSLLTRGQLLSEIDPDDIPDAGNLDIDAQGNIIEFPPVDIPPVDIDPNSTKKPVAFDSDGIPIFTTPSTITYAGGNVGLTDDVYRGQKQVLSEQMEKILNPLRNKDGQMDRKWLAIAAGAFNAAQKGAPTLMAGLADLGGGVTEQLQSLDKEDQERAIALMAIYQKQMQLDETARGHNLTYDAAIRGQDKTYQASVNKSIIDLQKSTDPLDQLKYLQTSAKDYATVNEKIATGLLDPSYKYTNDILHSGQGNVVAQNNYNTYLDEIKTKENQIIEQVEKEFNTDYDPNNAEHKTKADNLYQSWLSKNTGLNNIRKDYYSGRNQSDWVKSTLVL